MAALLEAEPATAQAEIHRPSDVAAWTLRHMAGPPTTWRALGLEANQHVAAWATDALAATPFATLTYAELAALG